MLDVASSLCLQASFPVPSQIARRLCDARGVLSSPLPWVRVCPHALLSESPFTNPQLDVISPGRLCPRPQTESGPCPFCA